METRTFKSDDGDTLTTDDPRVIRFVNDMEEAGIPWRTYSGRGMYGAESAGVDCPSSGWPSEQDVHRATEVRLSGDSMGLGSILYVHTTKRVEVK